MGIATQDVLIANAGTKSTVADIRHLRLVGIIIPAAFTGTAITFEVCDTAGGTFQAVYTSANAALSITVAQGRSYTLDDDFFAGAAFIKVVSGSAEGADRTVRLLARSN